MICTNGYLVLVKYKMVCPKAMSSPDGSIMNIL